MYEFLKVGSKAIDVIEKNLDERKISVLFSALAMSTVLNHTKFLETIENTNLDRETKEKIFYKSLYLHIRRIVSSKVILDEIKSVTKDSSALIKKKLLGELEQFSLHNDWLIEDSIQEYKDNIEPGRSENLDFSITLILRATKEDEVKRSLYKKMLKESFQHNEKIILKVIKERIKNKELDKLMLFLGSAIVEFGSIIERDHLNMKCNDIGKNLSKFLLNEWDAGEISVALNFIFVQGLIISIGYKEMFEIEDYQYDELENAIFEIAFFHTRLLIRNKEVLNKLDGYSEGIEVKKELLKELDYLVLKNGRNMKKSMNEFRSVSKKEGSIGEKEYITSRALKLFKQDVKLKELFEFHLKNSQNKSLKEINELLSDMENKNEKKEAMSSLLFRKAII
jgi:hypothetical protein